MYPTLANRLIQELDMSYLTYVIVQLTSGLILYLEKGVERRP